LSFVFRQAEEFNYSKAENKVKVGLVWGLGIRAKRMWSNQTRMEGTCWNIFLDALINNFLFLNVQMLHGKLVNEKTAEALIIW